MKDTASPVTTTEYIARFPPAVRKQLSAVRRAIKEAAPAAEEMISYRMPSFHQDGPVAYFAAFKSHVGFYPTASGIERFKKDLAGYQSSKGAVQFPLDEPMPLALIKRIVRFKVKENAVRKER
jgi:uncharacterized protein YdhG (YjbR/CyaY superfamily)